METIEICRKCHTGSDSDIYARSDFNGYCTHFLGSERISESESESGSVSVNIPLDLETSHVDELTAPSSNLDIRSIKENFSLTVVWLSQWRFQIPVKN